MEAELLAGRYQLTTAIGKGATGQVWRARDIALKRNVAIKIVDLEGAKDPAMKERFNREGIAIAGVKDPGVVQVHDTGTDDTRGWLVMEYLNGPNLSQLVAKRGPLGYREALPLLSKVASGLQAAHDGGITHRDVKPANIVLHARPNADGDIPDMYDDPLAGYPTMVDFGIAQIVDEAGKELTRPATAIGTAAYMSPEQARGKKTGPASDVYSLACVTYFLMAGRPPFVSDNSVAVAHSQAFDVPPTLSSLAPNIPEALDEFLLRMLAKNDAERPTGKEVSKVFKKIAKDPGYVLPGADEATTVLALDTGTEELSDTGTNTVALITRSSRGRRVAVGLVIAALAIGLALSMLNRRGPDVPPPTVTMTQTATATHTTASEPTTEFVTTPNPTYVAPPNTTYGEPPAPQPPPRMPTQPAPPMPEPPPAPATTSDPNPPAPPEPPATTDNPGGAGTEGPENPPQ